MNVQPINNNVIVRPDAAETISAGGIITNGNSDYFTNMGTVLASGSKEVKEGDRVMFEAYGLNQTEIDGEKCLTMTDKDIIGVFE